MPALNHAHKYVRVSYKQRTQYMCAHPDCSHVKHKMYLNGKRSICNTCDNQFLLDQYCLTLAKPQCMKCRKDKKAKKVNKATKLALKGIDLLS